MLMKLFTMRLGSFQILVQDSAYYIMASVRCFRRLLSTARVPAEERAKQGLPRKWPIPGIDSIVMVASGKGGVGKSTTAGMTR